MYLCKYFTLHQISMSDNAFAECLHKSNIYVHQSWSSTMCFVLFSFVLKFVLIFFLIMEMESQCLAQAGMELVL